MSLCDVLGVGVVEPGPTPSLRQPDPTYGSSPWPAYRLEEPPGAADLPARALRRLGTAQALGLSAVKRSLDGSLVDIEQDEAVAVCAGTSWAELGDEVAFVERLCREGERGASPAKFSNSVHNAVASQIAIHFGWRGENVTFTHSALSFETALGHAGRLFRLGRTRRAVVCGVDALTDFLLLRGHLLGLFDPDPAPLAPLQPGRGRAGTVPGEGGAAFVLGAPGSTPRRLARIHCAMVRGPAGERGPDALEALATAAPEAMDLPLAEVDLLLLGANGSSSLDAAFEEAAARVRPLLAAGVATGVVRHRTGDFETASALALAYAVGAVGDGGVPPAVRLLDGARLPRAGAVLLLHLNATGHASLMCVAR